MPFCEKNQKKRFSLNNHFDACVLFLHSIAKNDHKFDFLPVLTANGRFVFGVSKKANLNVRCRVGLVGSLPFGAIQLLLKNVNEKEGEQ